MANIGQLQPSQYGDIERLKALSTGTKQVGGTYGPTVQRNPVGRPSTQPQGEAQAAPPQLPQMPSLPPEHQQLFTAYATAEATAQKWESAAADPTSDPSARWYANIARQQANQLASLVKRQTPDFDGV